MSVIINFKICDNAKECNGISVCPTGALSWNEKKETIKIDNKKCESCFLCEKACMVDAIHVAKNQKEYKRIKREINKDPRKYSDLCIDRYGAQPIHIAFLLPEYKFKLAVLESNKLVVAEFFDDDSIMCMLKSIPIRELFKEADIKYRKVKIESSKLLKKYLISDLPAMLFFKKGKLVGKVTGFYDTEQKEKLLKKIGEIIN